MDTSVRTAKHYLFGFLFVCLFLMLVMLQPTLAFGVSDGADKSGCLQAQKARIAVYDEDDDEAVEDEYEVKLFVNCGEYDDGDGDWHIGSYPICYGDAYVNVSVMGYSDWEDEAGDYGEKIKGADVWVQIAGKTYQGKTAANGKARIGIPLKKVGTAVKVSFTYGKYSGTKSVKIKGAQKKYSYYRSYIEKHGEYADGTSCDPYIDGAWDRREKFNSNIKIKPTYAASGQTGVIVRQATKGDSIKVKIGKKAYVKRIKKSISAKTLLIKHPKMSAGSKIEVVQYNKYKQKMGTAKSIVFSVAKLRKGLTKNQVRLMRTYGSPDSSSNMTYGWWEYDYYNGYGWSVAQTIYFTRNRVSGWINY